MSATTYRITAPDNRTRHVVGVPFQDGVGFTADPARLAFFERRGWDVDEITELIGEPLTPEQEAELAELTAQGLTVPVLNTDGTVTPGTIPGSGEFVAAGAEADEAQRALNTQQEAAEAAEREAKEAAARADAEKAEVAAAEAAQLAADKAAADEAAAAAAQAAEAEKAAKAKPAAKSTTVKK